MLPTVLHAAPCSHCSKATVMLALHRGEGGFSCNMESMVLHVMQASKLPAAVDRAWEAVGGGPADLFFPEVRAW